MDPFTELQNTIEQVLPIVLLGPGLILVGSGLFIWLGGLRWLKAIAAFCAALAGLLCAWFFTERQLVPLVLFPVILAGVGVYLNKVIVVMLGAAVGALIVLLAPIAANIDYSPEQTAVRPPAEQPFGLLESVEWIQAKINEAKQAVKDAIAAIPESRKNTAIGVAVLICATGLFSWRLVCAATCSVIGTLLIACGMAVLLLYKGAESFKQMIEMRQVLGLAALGMIVAGVLVQLTLCPSKPKKKTKADMMNDILEEGKK